MKIHQTSLLVSAVGFTLALLAFLLNIYTYYIDLFALLICSISFLFAGKSYFHYNGKNSTFKQAELTYISIIFSLGALFLFLEYLKLPWILTLSAIAFPSGFIMEQQKRKNKHMRYIIHKKGRFIKIIKTLIKQTEIALKNTQDAQKSEKLNKRLLNLKLKLNKINQQKKSCEEDLLLKQDILP